jgi:voltage-gated potassium channel
MIVILLWTVIVIAGGTAGYMHIERWSMFDALYMTIITVTTVGFGEIHPLSPFGRIFTVGLIFLGLGIVAYATTSVVQYVIAGELRLELDGRRRQRMLEKLQNHYIVCGYGRMGRHVAEELHRQKKSFVIIDTNEQEIETCREAGYITLLGDASEDAVLEEAGIRRARSLITAVSSDAENVFIVLTARSMCPQLVIVSRANVDEAVPKLRRAGANHVVVPYAIGGRRMVSSADHPEVVDFLDVVMHSPELELWLEDLTVMAGSAIEGRSLADAHIRSKIGVNILSLQLPGGKMQLQPDVHIPLKAGTRLIAMGTREQLERLTDLVNSNSHHNHASG